MVRVLLLCPWGLRWSREPSHGRDKEGNNRDDVSISRLQHAVRHVPCLIDAMEHAQIQGMGVIYPRATHPAGKFETLGDEFGDDFILERGRDVDRTRLEDTPSNGLCCLLLHRGHHLITASLGVMVSIYPHIYRAMSPLIVLQI